MLAGIQSQGTSVAEVVRLGASIVMEVQDGRTVLMVWRFSQNIDEILLGNRTLFIVHGLDSGYL